MDVAVEFNQSAFRHDISKEDILSALKKEAMAASDYCGNGSCPRGDVVCMVSKAAGEQNLI